jgi:hypothetical protein
VLPIKEMKKLLFIVIFSVGISLNVNAESIGLVSGSCGYFIQKDRDDYDNWRFEFTFSFQAYVSALEYMTKENRVEELSGDSLYYSVLNRCKKEPLLRIDETLLRVYFEDLEIKQH